MGFLIWTDGFPFLRTLHDHIRGHSSARQDTRKGILQKKIFQGSVSPSYLVTDLSRSRTRSERQNRRRIPACAAIYAGTGRILVHVRHLRPLPVRAHHLQMDP